MTRKRPFQNENLSQHQFMSWTWIAIIIGAVALFGLFVLAAARRRGPDIEQAFVDAEIEAEEETRAIQARGLLDSPDKRPE